MIVTWSSNEIVTQENAEETRKVKAVDAGPLVGQIKVSLSVLPYSR